MAKCSPKWEGRRAEIQKMVEAGWADPKIAAHYQVKPGTITMVRSQLGITRRFFLHPYPSAEPLPPPPVATTEYTDETGRKITKAEPRYAEGAIGVRYSALPTGKGRTPE